MAVPAHADHGHRQVGPSVAILVAEQNSLSSPQPISGANLFQGTGSVARTQWVYDASNFVGITTPILITKLRFRANGAVLSDAAAGMIGQ